MILLLTAALLYLEDSNLPETQTWIAEQKAKTTEYFSHLDREPIRQKLEELWKKPQYKGIFEGFVLKNDGQNQSVLYTLDGEIAFDPNTLSEDGTTAVSFYRPCGNLLAYGVTQSGSDWQEIRVRDHPDQLQRVKFNAPAWLPSGEGFYYCQYAEKSHQKVYFHQLGTEQNEDVLVYERPDHPEWLFAPSVSEDGKYLLLYVMSGCDKRHGFFYQDLSSGQMHELIQPLDAVYHCVHSEGETFWFHTTKNAPNGCLMCGNTVVIPEQENPLHGVTFLADQFITHYLKDAYSIAKIYRKDGTFERDLAIPPHGSIVNNSDPFQYPSYFTLSQGKICYGFTSFVQPTTIYSDSEVLFQSPFNDDYEITPAFYPSKDGTQIPISLCHKKGLDIRGNHPTILYGYGGFAIPVTSNYSPAIPVWLDMGGIYAIAHIRGGTEYGCNWHEAAIREKRQTAFDDFIAAAEWLIDQGITSTPRLAIKGRSNGGLLVGACLTQRPDLFGAAIPEVGVHDMLRFHLFTIGWGWIPEYGNPDNPEDAKFLRSYSPLHNVRRVAYPPTLVTTSEHDDRVVPSHSYKFAAALQEGQTGPAPILIRIEENAGHGAGKPTSKLIDETADIYTFLQQVTKLGLVEGEGEE